MRSIWTSCLIGLSVLGCRPDWEEDVKYLDPEETGSAGDDTAASGDTGEPDDDPEDTGDPNNDPEDTGEPKDDPVDTGEPKDDPEPVDEDGDGFSVDEDCDDGNAEISPAASEICDGIDNDCDGEIDESDALDPSTWWLDADGDGYGDETASTASCETPEGYVEPGDADCDDTDSTVNPGASEVCDGVDNDCDGYVDDADPDVSGLTTWYIDYDSDGAGSDSYTVEACEAPSGYVSADDDCDDTDSSAFPGGTEVCDGADNDCDGDVDEDEATDASTWYTDADSDGYGDPATADVECEAPSGTVADDTDCDDTDATVYPGAPELHDSQDNDCDGDSDEDLWIGTGADGDLSVAIDTDLSIDASGSRSEPDAVAYALSAINGTSLALEEDADGIEAADEVLIINLQGSTTLYAAVGTYEFASVASASGDTLELEEALSEIYGETDNADLSDQVIIVQRVPNYTDVEVLSGAILSTSTWDGETGGVLAFRATGTVWVEDGGSIDVSELGYAAGDTGTCNNCDAFQGESIGGEGIGDEYGGTYNESIGGYLANLGGGGANITGGGGAYGEGATPGDAWYPGTFTAPEAGEEYGEAELEQIFFGSGGGGVWNGGSDAVDEDPGPGGDGGGIVYIGAGSLVLDGESAITATGGTTEHWAWGTWTYGAGGGAGGSVYLVADEVELAADSVDAVGGLGQGDYTRIGGDGGEGRVRIDCSSCNGFAQGSADAESALNDAAEPTPGHSESPE
jgi:hypothetical protein